jgi:hypothetical protein
MVAGAALSFFGSAVGARAQSSAAQPSTALATLPAYRARVLGVFDEGSGSAVEGVRVLDLATGVSALTTKTGTVSLVYLPEGGSLVRLQKVGYEPQTMLIAIGPKETSSITVVMRQVTELAAMVSKGTAPIQYLGAGLRGFQERERLHLFGVFFNDSILRREEGRRLADLLRGRANAPISEGRFGAATLGKSPRCPVGGGPPQVYLDGVPLPGSVNLSQFDLSTLTGVEYYQDSNIAPVEFNSSNRCGALLLWTRER